MSSIREAIVDAKLIAIIRGDYHKNLYALAGALVDGGMRAIEITMNSPHALAMMETLSREYGGQLLVGAGTVTEAAQVAQVNNCGAQFVVSPDTFPEVIQAALAHELEPLPGAYTPTEIQTARRAGATLIKLFPASVGGPAYLRQILAPFDDVLLVPTGGVSLENGLEFFRAGAVALGIGSSLIPKAFDGSPEQIRELTERVRQWVDIVRQIKVMM